MPFALPRTLNILFKLSKYSQRQPGASRHNVPLRHNSELTIPQIAWHFVPIVCTVWTVTTLLVVTIIFRPWPTSLTIYIPQTPYQYHISITTTSSTVLQTIMAEVPTKPLLSFGDPAHHRGDPPCSLCLHVHPEKELLFCDQCKLKVHSICWVFLRKVFSDLDEWPCAACHLPLDKAIELALRGSVPSADEVTADMLTRRVFFARRAMNQARWAVAIGTPKNEAIEIALRAMYQDIPLEHAEQQQLQPSQALMPEQKDQAMVPFADITPSETKTIRTRMRPSQTDQKHEDHRGRREGTQQVYSYGSSAQPQPAQLPLSDSTTHYHLPADNVS